MNAVELKSEWSADGQFMTLIVKTCIKKKWSNQVLVFDTNHSNFSMGSQTFQKKIMAVGCAPGMKRLAVAVAKNADIAGSPFAWSQQCYVMIYDMNPQPDSIKMELLASTDGLDLINEIKWAANGLVVAAGSTVAQSSDNLGKVHIFMLKETPTKTHLIHKIETVHRKHGNVFEWDPLSRFLLVGNFDKRKQASSDRGLKIFGLTGQEFYDESNPEFFGFAWRPRASVTLNVAQEKDFKKQYKKVIFKELNSDDKENRRNTKETMTKINVELEEAFFNKWRAHHQHFKETKAQRHEILVQSGLEELPLELMTEKSVAWHNN